MDEQPIEVFARPGRVRWFDARRGYGFIVGPQREGVMVHHSVIEGPGFRPLRDGQAVRFDAMRTDKGWKATRVDTAADGDAGQAGIAAVPTRPPGLL